MGTIRLILVEDHVILRESLRLLIHAQPDMQVVGETGDPREAIGLVRTLEPDVTCLDLSLPRGSGVQLAEQLCQMSPPARILVLTTHDDPAHLRAALAAGVLGYVLKSSTPPVLLKAIRVVCCGEGFIDPTLERYLDSAPPRQGDATPAQQLSPRERQILELLARGLSYAHIAEQLFLSIKTIETYRTRLAKKLHFKTKADLVLYAIESGILSNPPSDLEPNDESSPPAE